MQKKQIDNLSQALDVDWRKKCAHKIIEDFKENVILNGPPNQDHPKYWPDNTLIGQPWDLEFVKEQVECFKKYLYEEKKSGDFIDLKISNWIVNTNAWELCAGLAPELSNLFISQCDIANSLKRVLNRSRAFNEFIINSMERAIEWNKNPDPSNKHNWFLEIENKTISKLQKLIQIVIHDLQIRTKSYVFQDLGSLKEIGAGLLISDFPEEPNQKWDGDLEENPQKKIASCTSGWVLDIYVSEANRRLRPNALKPTTYSDEGAPNIRTRNVSLSDLEMHITGQGGIFFIRNICDKIRPIIFAAFLSNRVGFILDDQLCQYVKLFMAPIKNYKNESLIPLNFNQELHFNSLRDQAHILSNPEFEVHAVNALVQTALSATCIDVIKNSKSSAVCRALRLFWTGHENIESPEARLIMNIAAIEALLVPSKETKNRLFSERIAGQFATWRTTFEKTSDKQREGQSESKIDEALNKNYFNIRSSMDLLYDIRSRVVHGEYVDQNTLNSAASFSAFVTANILLGWGFALRIFQRNNPDNFDINKFQEERIKILDKRAKSITSNHRDKIPNEFIELSDGQIPLELEPQGWPGILWSSHYYIYPPITLEGLRKTLGN